MRREREDSGLIFSLSSMWRKYGEECQGVCIRRKGERVSIDTVLKFYLE